MTRTFPFYRQRDAMDCGPACLMMAAAAHGRKYPLTFLRDHSFLSREGVSAQGIMEAAETIGFRSMTVKVPYDSGQETACLLTAPLPCIAHWNQRHFVVVYKISPRDVWIADPAEGKIKVSRAGFEKSWTSDAGKGILILLEPTPQFYRMEHDLPEERNSLLQLFSYVRPFRRLMVQLLLGTLLGSLLLLAFPFLTQSIVDTGINNRNLGFINLILIGQLMLFSSQIVVQFLQSRIILFIGARINVAMISDFLSKLMRLPIGFFDTKMTGDLLQRIGDQSRVESFLTGSVLRILFSALNFLVFGFILLLYSPAVFGIFMLAALLYTGWILFFLRRRKELDYLRFQQSGENSSTLIEMIQGMQEIKLQGSERKRRWVWAGIQAKLFHTSLRSLDLSQWQEAGAGFINQTKNIFITFLAARAVVEGDMTLGMMLAIQYMVGQLDAPLQQFIAFVRSAQDARISLERMAEIRNQPDEDTQAMPGAALHSDMLHGTPQDAVARFQGDIQLNNLSFRYNALQDDVLKNLNLIIPQGKVTAVVGMSGSGKTTLLKLLLGFYQPTQGSIHIGALPMRTIAPSVWRQRCGAVLQDGFLFSDTIANNISECDEYPDKLKLWQAVEVANIRSFVDELPLGYNTKIGAQGNGISQGQRQRMLIARAVYKSPDFLFFDEATNALDANNERAIVENLQDFYRNKTVVVVAHRLSTVRHADQIVVLEHGVVSELGTHEELVARRGAYYELVKNQLELGS